TVDERHLDDRRRLGLYVVIGGQRLHGDRRLLAVGRGGAACRRCRRRTLHEVPHHRAGYHERGDAAADQGEGVLATRIRSRRTTVAAAARGGGLDGDGRVLVEAQVLAVRAARAGLRRTARRGIRDGAFEHRGGLALVDRNRQHGEHVGAFERRRGLLLGIRI